MINLKHAKLEITDTGCISRFPDGTSYGAHPHLFDHHYHVVAHRLGYQDDIMRYCREHEAMHHIVGEFFYDRPSRIIWALAHGHEVAPSDAAYEETMVMTCQRWVRTNERPIVADVDWDALKYRALAVMGEL
jgi:hypothetical protein